MANVSVLILTRNEQNDLPGCLASVSWCDDVHVFDSNSSDATCEIARKFGATVTGRDYGDNTAMFGGDESGHRNWALRNLPFRHEWIFVLDADERVSPQLASEIAARAESPGECVAFQVQRRDFLMDTWLEHVQTTPYYIRLFRPSRLHYKRLVNPVSVVDGPIGRLTGYLDHYPFSKGIGHWIERHNHYSHFEARQIVENRLAQAGFSVIKALCEKDFHKRRFHQKELFYRMPCRPLMKFLLLYVGKRGFLDGRAGFTYAVLQAIYEYFIVLKVREFGRLRTGPRTASVAS
jgi:glycosyltransferase involved in cell wall biosynthesis